MVDGTPEVAGGRERLGEALEALQRGDRGRALTALLEAWAPSRGPRLTALVVRLGEEAARGLPAIAGATRQAFHEQWLDVASRAWPADLSRLLEGLRHPPWTRFRERLQRLERFPPDPRVGLALARFVDEVPVRSSLLNSAWRQLFRLLDRSAHQGCAGWLRPRRPGVLAPSVVERELIDPSRARTLAELPPGLDPVGGGELLTALEAAVEALAAGPPAGEEQLAPGGSGQAADEAGLLAAVYAAPADDAPRLVYADWLLERGDPRGTFIQWQFRSAAGGAAQAHLKHEAQLLRRHLAAWLGPLEPAVVPGTARFERGFLAEAETRFASPRQRAELAGHPAWSTLRVHRHWSPLLEAGHLPELREVKGALLLEEAVPLAERARPLPRLEELLIRPSPEEVGRGMLRRLGAGPGLPALVSLVVVHAAPAWFEQLEGTPLGARLQRLWVRSSITAAEAWWPLCRALPSLTLLELDWPRTVQFARRGGAWEVAFGQGWEPDRIEEVLHGLDPAPVRVPPSRALLLRDSARSLEEAAGLMAGLRRP